MTTKTLSKKKPTTKKRRLKDFTIRVCVGTGGLAAGSQEVINTFTKELKAKGLKANVERKCVNRTGCRGFCAKDVLVDLIVNGGTSTYQLITADMVSRIVEEHIINGKPVEEWLVGPDYHAFHDKQTKILLKQCGHIDPEDINAYIEIGGYKGAKKALSLNPVTVIDNVKKSGLRGRGGAGFPTGLKWEFCSKNKEKTKYIICNADEGDPGAFMDRSIIEGNPHAVLEGMIIGGYAIGANYGYIYIRAEYPLAVERLKIAIKEATKTGYLGKNIFKTKFDFNIRINEGAGAFICGEETALIASLEGKRGMPRSKPPFPANKGLWGKPTIINNVETLATLPAIITRGAMWFSSIGTEKSKGTKVFALTGNIRNSGLIEVPMGIPLREIIYDIGGGMEKKQRKLKAVQTGGPSGGCIPASHIDMPVDYESLINIGSMMGSGGMVVMDDMTCMVDMSKFFLSFTQSESCGKCVPCRIGTKRMLEILVRITEGRGKKGDIELLIELGTDIKLSSLCGLGQSAPNPVLSTIRFFRDEYEAHVNEGRCPASVCKALRQYFVTEECKMCGKCMRVCPSGAITWEKKKPAVIDKSKCVKCGECFDACSFGTII